MISETIRKKRDELPTWLKQTTYKDYWFDSGISRDAAWRAEQKKIFARQKQSLAWTFGDRKLPRPKLFPPIRINVYYKEKLKFSDMVLFHVDPERIVFYIPTVSWLNREPINQFITIPNHENWFVELSEDNEY